MAESAGFTGDSVVAVVVIGPNGERTSHTSGTLLDGRAMSTSTIVYGASQTKQLIAMCAARLERAGKLDPDRAIAHWFPDWPEWSNRVTVRHLVHHRSGMPDEETLLARMAELGHERRTSDTMLAAIATFSELAAEPGERYEYSNIGYVTLGRIVELETGQSLIDHLAETVFAPLGMGQSRLWEGPEDHPAEANPLDPDQPVPHSLGDGGMWTTADDFSRWLRAMLDDRFGVRDLMARTLPLNDGTANDYAWALRATESNGLAVLGHGGAWWGSRSKSAWIPERGSGFIIFTVDGGEPLDALSDALIERLTTTR
jgi:CubicO group peptidase (beta-lactamase class C family)